MERLTIDEAAARLGVSVSTVRRRIRDGILTVEREETAQGFRYYVILEEPATVSTPGTPTAQNVDAQLAQLTADRDWLRSRVEELTALLNREQELGLRRTTDQRLLTAYSPDSEAPTQAPSRVEYVPTIETPTPIAPPPPAPAEVPSQPPTGQARPQRQPGFWRRALEALRGP